MPTLQRWLLLVVEEEQASQELERIEAGFEAHMAFLCFWIWLKVYKIKI